MPEIVSINISVNRIIAKAPARGICLFCSLLIKSVKLYITKTMKRATIRNSIKFTGEKNNAKTIKNNISPSPIDLLTIFTIRLFFIEK